MICEKVLLTCACIYCSNLIFLPQRYRNLKQLFSPIRIIRMQENGFEFLGQINIKKSP